MIGIDLGGTRIKLAEVEDGTVLRSKIVHTPAGGPPARVLDAIAEGVRELSASPRELGMAIPGEVDATGKCWRLPNIPGFEGVEIARELGDRTGARVTVENDGTTAAYGEALYGHGTAHASFLMVTLGTGIGGGLVLDRRLVRGAHGFAAEIGHVTVDSSPTARPCVCGNRGCLEAYAGTVALLDSFRSAGGSATEVRDLADSAHRGEAAGRAAFDAMARALAIAVNSIQNVLDLDAVVFTGGISKAFDLVEPGLRAELRSRCFAKPLGEVPLLVSELGELAGVIGAAHLPGLEARRG
jgi:glucokinase